MNARILTATAVVTALSGALPAKAADQQLLNLLMPDAKVVAGVNVVQAKSSPFGQYILQQIQLQNGTHLSEFAVQTGFNPTQDVQELLVGTSATSATPRKENGLVLARGNFNVAGITAAATQHGALVETYRGATIIQDPKRMTGIAFVNTTLVVAGDIANVKAALDRQSAPAVLPASLLAQINEWSNSQDAWVVSAVPPSSLHPKAGAPKIPGVGPGQDAFQSIQQAAGGVRFGSIITVKAQGQADTAQSAQQMSDALKFLANLAQMQGGSDAAAQALLQSLNISSTSNYLNVSVSMPSDQLVGLVTPKRATRTRPQRIERKQ